MWLKIGADVAWGAKGDSHGTLKVSSKVCGTRVKFVHKSGSVSCGSGMCVMPAHIIYPVAHHLHACVCAEGASNFGCNGNSLKGLGLGILLIDNSKASIAPATGMREGRIHDVRVCVCV